ncbi:hypothetical protein bthur0014_65230 [Bacillus thuringiensis IBL 4222]|uniref:Uncharacterized protein n=2 Tax=Bacillus cereus group TaxID=86661 RepID=B7IX64_BACC2|nr:hypothetical protein BCG9842_B2866 [Bacillus cereus G9842]AFQ26139.1 hypothetical protein BTF1_09660 [Bacillus thuringiensis HD-789]EEM38389.1 hypothetical protein bthur0004_57370 [Bacillus thuringiensis serovar sotto str. T04001]EEM98895.1 hypothetical protein bthur0014_65230 [Bacillus thuringiensis IBL 4222]
MRKPNEIKIDTVERLLQEVINRTKLDEILEIKNFNGKYVDCCLGRKL